MKKTSKNIGLGILMTCLLTGNIVYTAEAAYDIELTDTHKWHSDYYSTTSLLGAFQWYRNWNNKYNDPEYKNVHVTFNDRLGDDGKKYGLSILSSNSNKFYVEQATIDLLQGATLKSSTGGLYTIDIPSNSSLKELTLNIADGDLIVEHTNDNSNSAISLENGKTLNINGGNRINLISDTVNSYENAVLRLQGNANFILKDADSMYIGVNDSTQNGVIGIGLNDYSKTSSSSKVDIELNNELVINAAAGIASGGNDVVNISADKGIVIDSTYLTNNGNYFTESDQYRYHNGMGIYLRDAGDSLSGGNVQLTAAKGDISVTSYRSAVAALRKESNVSLNAQNINMIGNYDRKNLNTDSKVIPMPSFMDVYAVVHSDKGSNVNLEAAENIEITSCDNVYGKLSAADNKQYAALYASNSGNIILTGVNKDIYGKVISDDGGNITFNDNASGITSVIYDARKTDTKTAENAVLAYSDTDEQTQINFYQSTMINARGGETAYHNMAYERSATAIRANRNSQVNLNTEGNSYALYGDIIAGRGVENSDAVGGEINIGGTGTIIRGDILAGNTGKININLTNGNIEGRIDDYGDAGNGNVFDPEEFDVAVTESGNVGVTLKDSVWTARHQSWVTSLELDNSLVDLTKDEASSVTIGKLSGSGVFNMRLNSEDHSKGDMLYIGEGSGTHTVNIVGGITGGLENISEDNPLRFATVKNSGGILEVVGSGINAYTKDAGIYDLEYFVTKEDFDKNDEENEVYNGGANGSINDGTDKGFKPGNDFVENVLDAEDTAENWIITGVKEKKESDTVDTIINMSRANYKNAVYMDRLNKRLGEARYIDGDEGMWVRMRHDRIGMKDEFRSMNTMYQLGYDKLDNKDNKGERHIGAAIDYMDGSTSYSDIYGEGETRRWGFWIYDTWLGSKGHYADYIAKFGHMHNEFDIRSMNTGEKITGDYDNNVFSISAEYGRKKDIGNNWYFEPQAQLQLARVTDAEYKTSQDTDVYVDGINSLIGRAGFRLGKDVDERSTVYIKADVLHEFLGDQRITASDATGYLDKTYENKGTWYDVGFGFATAVGHNSYAYMDFEKSFGNDNDDTYQINAGLQWSFK